MPHDLHDLNHPAMPTHYDILQVSISADNAAIKKAYRALALTHHPDKTLHHPDAERAKREKLFKLATNAYDILLDASNRTAYDRHLRSTRPVASTRNPEKKQKEPTASTRSPERKYKRPSAKAYTQPPPRQQPQEPSRPGLDGS
jgi:DnaJ-class molecular chaperone